MLAGQLVDTPLERFAQAEVVAAQGQHRFRQHRAEQPVRQRHRHRDHPPAARPAHDLPAVDQAEAAGGLDAAGGEVGGDAGAGQPLEGIAQPGIPVAAGVAVGGDQQVVRLELQCARHLAPGIERRHQLADAVDQDVLVVDRGAPPHRGRDLDLGAVVGIIQHPPVGPGREREDRVLHGAQIVLGRGIENVAREQIGGRMTVGQKPSAGGVCRCAHRALVPALPPIFARARFRGFSDTHPIFIHSPRPARQRGIRVANAWDQSHLNVGSESGGVE